MKWCVEFPEESILVVRPCLKHICLDISPAANLLSSLLYRYSIRKESQEDADNINALKVAKGEKADQDTSYRIYRTQAQIAKDTCYEVSEKTLHDVAIPTLQFMGYMDLEEYPGRNCYILHMDRIVAAIAAYKKGPEGLKAFFSSIPQLEKVLIGIQLEKVLINKKYFLSQLEKVLIANRNISYCKRGRKARTEDSLDTQIPKPQISIEINKKISNNTEEESDGSIEPITSLTPEQMIAFLSANGYTVLPGNNPLIAESSVTQNTHPLCTPLLQGGANTHPSSDNVTPPTTSVAITPHLQGENTASSIQVDDSTSHATTTPVENSEESHDNTPTSKIACNDTAITPDVSQREIEGVVPGNVSAESVVSVEKPAIPVMPISTMKWSPEKLVQITEAKRIVKGKIGAYFNDKIVGSSSKSQRQRQLDAAKSIIARKITEQQYIVAYDETNNDWWNAKGSVTVETMQANTPRSVMRVVEVTEKLETRSETTGATISTFTPRASSVPAQQSRMDYTKEEMNDILSMSREDRKAFNAKRRAARELQAVGK